ncbi:MAG: PorP/SprF family type IX secretion system membrane protein [Bacteroidota bacterium]
MRKIYTLALFLIGCWGAVQAQDPSFSQFYANKLYLNPAFAGSQPGLTLSMAYRSQWSYVPGGFKTYSLGVDIQEPLLSSTFGFFAMQDQEGAGALKTLHSGFIYGYIIRASKNFNIHMAVKTSYNEKSVDWSKLTFTDQLDPVYGVIRPTTAVPIVERKQYVDFDAGLVARFSAKIGKLETNNNIGFAVHHLAEPDESLQLLGTTVPRRYTFHAGSMLPINYWTSSDKRIFYISPNIKFDYQNNIKVLTYGFYALSSPFYVGLFYQNQQPAIDLNNTNALIVVAGLEGNLSKVSTYTIGYSFDANMTGLSTTARGVHELTFRMNFQAATFFGAKKGFSQGPRGGSSGRRKYKGDCYKFKGKNAVSIF